MDSAEHEFLWENEGTSFEEKGVLVDSLPEGFKYHVKKLKIHEQSEIKEELKFKLEFNVSICDKEGLWCLSNRSKLKTSLDIQTGIYPKFYRLFFNKIGFFVG